MAAAKLKHATLLFEMPLFCVNLHLGKLANANAPARVRCCCRILLGSQSDYDICRELFVGVVYSAQRSVRSRERAH